MRDWQVVLEVYPQPDSPHFEEYSCAAAAFYLRSSNQDNAVHIAERELLSEGWTRARIIGIDQLRFNSRSSEDREIRRVLQEGRHVCNLRRVPRLIIGELNAKRERIATLYDRFVARVREDAFVLHSKAQGAYATLVREGQDIFPIWVASGQPERWCDQWSLDHSVERIDVVKLVSVIREQLSDDTLLTIGLTATALVAFHPSALMVQLDQRNEL